MTESTSTTAEPRTNVLVIDDDLFFAQILCDLLMQAGLAATIYIPGTHDISDLDDIEGFQLVLCDYYLPYIESNEFLRTLRKMVPSAAIICLSGDHPDDMDKLINEGTVNAFLQKPCSRESLLSTISSLTSRT